MKLSNAFSLLTDLRFGLAVAWMPTLKAILASPTLLFRPHALSRVYMANLWLTFGDGVDGNGKDTKNALITPHAYGVVLDIGAGHGHTVRYLNAERVSRYIALEPNALMHPQIRAQANAAGFHEADGTLIILACGAEDTKSILSALALALPAAESSPTVPPVDTLVSILTLCTIPEPQRTISNLVRDVLKPGGQFLMYEHVLSQREDVAWWQRFWAPLWSLGFDGCRMDRPSDVWVTELKVESEGGEKQSAWRESRTWLKEGEEEENLFFHSVGRFVKQ
ncbi:S-adenosyl-L-methionine-dependent methyltransferase [Flammula alnicola]|nr:S-adenosyl-L-methionine-dependent methyltransferase [Flammula alnicola]